MNRIYRLIWSKTANALVAVSEIARGHGKSSGTIGAKPGLSKATVGRAMPVLSVSKRPDMATLLTQPRLITLSLALAFNSTPARALDANALPSGGQVVAGSATISQAANTLNVNQASQRAALDWQSFNIGSAATVNFIQPNSSAVALNRITGNSASEIYGKLNANGQVFFSNPNGMLFARGAQVNVGGILATTLNISNEDFMAGNYRLTNPSPNGGGAGVGVRNEGLINALGSAALIGNKVENAGIILATTVTLAAGNTVAIDLTGDGLIRARVEDPALRASIENSGSIEATQAVTMTAGQARTTLAQVVNNKGIIRATGFVMKGGEIVLEAGEIQNSGTLDASNANGAGGTVTLAATQKIDLTNSSRVGADGTAGGRVTAIVSESGSISGELTARGTISAQGNGTAGSGGFIETSADKVSIQDGFSVKTAGGNWLIDPVDFTIAASGGDITGATLSSNLGSGSVTILSSSGTHGGTAGDVNVNDVVSWSANKLTLNAQNNININANMTATSTASLALEYGQQVVAAWNTSNIITNGASISLPASTTNFTTKQGSDGAVKNYTVITSLGSAGSTTTTDLQGMSGGLGLNYALGANIDGSATSGWNASSGFMPVGDSTTAFTGTFDGLGHTINALTINRASTYNIGLLGSAVASVIRNVGLTNVTVKGYSKVGGLAGFNSGTINNSYATFNVSNSSQYFGGLVGENYGTVSNSYATGTLTTTSYVVGGLVGRNYGTVSNSYAAVNATGNFDVGGLVGQNGGLVGQNVTGTISDSYATGSVTATASIFPGKAGGLIGDNMGTVSNSHYNIDSVFINGGHTLGVGGLYNTQYLDWIAGSKSLNIANYSSTLVAAGGATYGSSKKSVVEFRLW